MIESVAARQRGAYDVEAYYDNLCALQDSVPLPAVKAHLHDRVLDLNGDRVRANDWGPIVNTLRINKTLEFVAIRSYFQQPVDEKGEIANEKKAYIWKKKTPAVRSKEVTYRLCKSLRECLAATPVMSCIELQGLPLRERDIITLAKGISKNHTLNHLSLEHCRIGDDGVEILCKGIKNSFNVSSINVTGCSLNSRGAELLARIIKHQAMKRHNEAWTDSLRYRKPDLDQMKGIRRITVNSNPLLGDQGAMAFAEALKDDLWLKALDMQQCGVGNMGATSLLDVLKFNTTIVVLDVRANPVIDRDVMQRIMEQVMINCNAQDTEYKWIRPESPSDMTRQKMTRKRKTKTLGKNVGRKTTIKVSRDSQMKWLKSSPALTPLRQSPGVASAEKGLPWRTALRAARYKGYPPEHVPGRRSVFENSEESIPTPKATPQVSIHVDSEDVTESTESSSVSDVKDIPVDNTMDIEYHHLRNLRVELEEYKRRCKEETDARSKAEERVLELTIENSRLKNEIATLEATKKSSLLDDDRILESIESSFKQFHSFLDILREAGLGHIITLAGLDQDAMPFGNTAQPTVPPRQTQYRKPQRDRTNVREDIENSFLQHRQNKIAEPPKHYEYERHGQGDYQNRKYDSNHQRSGIHGNYHDSPQRHKPRHNFTETHHRMSQIDITEPDSDNNDNVLESTHLDGTDGQGFRLTDRQIRDIFPQTPSILKPHTRPDNYHNVQDPTMASYTEEVIASKPRTAADDLYQRVLKETSSVLTHIGQQPEPVYARPKKSNSRTSVAPSNGVSMSRAPPAGRSPGRVPNIDTNCSHDDSEISDEEEHSPRDKMLELKSASELSETESETIHDDQNPDNQSESVITSHDIGKDQSESKLSLTAISPGLPKHHEDDSANFEVPSPESSIYSDHHSDDDNQYTESFEQQSKSDSEQEDIHISEDIKPSN